MKIKLRYGLTTLETTVDAGTTVGQIISSFKTALGLPENVDVLRNTNVAVNDGSVVVDGDLLTFEKADCEKAA